jgi:hypothetical protein
MNMNRAIPLLGLVLLTSCTTQRKIDRDELKSDLASGVSLASEARLYLLYSAERGSLGSFSEGHLQYLAREANSTKKELEQDVAGSEDSQVLDASRAQFEALSRQLDLIASRSSDANARIHSMRQLTEIGRAMEEAKRAL